MRFKWQPNMMSWNASKVEGLRVIWWFDNRWQLFWNRLFFRRTSLTVYRFNGREFLVDHAGGDACGARLCLTSMMYRKYLPMMTLDGPLNVLDLGANGGGFPLMLVSEGVPIKKLVYVEMNPQTFARAQFNVARNIEGQHKGINAAVCGSNRNIRLLLGTGSVSDTIYQPANVNASGKRQYDIPGITLDDIGHTEFPEPAIVDVLKMDVEGAEYEILCSASHELLKRVRYLIIELHEIHGYNKNDAIIRLSKIGFAECVSDDHDELDVHCFKNNRDL